MKRILADFKPGEQGLNKVLGNLESEVMDIVWLKGEEVTVRDVYEVLASKRKLAYTTIMTIMVRLAEKGILVSRKDGKTLYFLPAMSRQDFTASVVGDVVDSLLEDFAEDAMTHFLSRVKKSDKATIQRLEKLLAQASGGDEDDQ